MRGTCIHQTIALSTFLNDTNENEKSKTVNTKTFCPSSMFYITPLNDGKWHHLCLTSQASSGRQELFLDDGRGILGNEVINVSRNIPSGGRLVIGQRILSSGHEFDSSSSFQGQLNYLSLNALPHKLAMKVIRMIVRKTVGYILYDD